MGWGRTNFNLLLAQHKLSKRCVMYFLAVSLFLLLFLLVYITNMVVLLYIGLLLWSLVCVTAVQTLFNRQYLPLALQKTFALNSISVHYFLRLASFLCGLDTFFRYQDVEAFYTNSGVFPSSLYTAMCEEMGVCDFDLKTGGTALTRADHCLHLSSGDLNFQRLLFGTTFALAVFSMQKPKTWSLAVLYVLLSSMHRRNHFINDKGSMTLRVIQLWAVLLSFTFTEKEMEDANDAADGESPTVSKSTEQTTPALRVSAYTVSAGSVGFIFQVGMIYWFSAMYKYAPSADDSWSSGQAIDLALRFQEHSTAVGQFILTLPPVVLVVLTHVSGALESVGPFLFMSPFHTSFFRGVGVVSFVGFHMGIGITMNLGIFPVYSCALFVPLVPKEWWVYICCDRWRRKCSPEAMGGGRGESEGSEGSEGSKGSKGSKGSEGSEGSKGSKCSGNSSNGTGSNDAGNNVNNTGSSSTKFAQEKGIGVVPGANKYSLTKTQYKKQHGTTIVQQLSVVFISLLIFWWQASNIENGVPMPRAAREACAVLGLKQHWKLFTNLSSSITGNFDCRPVIIGVIKTPTKRQEEEIDDEQGVTLGPNHHVNLLRWKQDGFLNNPTLYQSVEQVLKDESPKNQGRENKLSFFKQMVNILTTTSNWARWTAAVRSNEFAMMATGDYFCRLWNRKRKTNVTVTMDGEQVDIIYGSTPSAVVNAAEIFCKHYNLANEQCQPLYDTMVKKSKAERLHHYYFLSVCEFGKVHGIRQNCYENDNRLSFEKDTRDLPVALNVVFQDLV